MGEVVMKKFFDKENFILSTFDDKQRKQSLVVSILVMVAFILSAFTFFNFLFGFVDAMGSIVSGSPDVAVKDLLRSVPTFLSFFMSVWTLLLFHASFRNVSEERRNKSLFRNAIAIICFGGLAIVYVVIGLIVGKYKSLVEGSPSPIYPLDIVLYSLVFIALGVCTILYLKKFAAKAPYLVPSRGPIVTKARFIYCFGVSIWMLCAFYGCSAFILGLFIVDFLHGHAFYGISLLLVYLLSALMLAIWEFYYNELKEEKRKEFLLPLAIVGLGCSVIVMALYFISLGTDLDAPSNMGFGVLPIAFAASVNMATLVMVFSPFIVSVVALIKGLLARKK